jgi:hypothetical protein
VKNLKLPSLRRREGRGGEFMYIGDYDSALLRRDPIGENLADHITPLFAMLIRSFYFSMFSHRQAWFDHSGITVFLQGSGARE